MTLRTKILLYLAVLHLALAVAAFLLMDEERLWLLPIETVLILSAFVGYRLVRGFFLPLELLRTGAELLAERDFSSTFRAIGQPEMDALIEIYNRMIERLREERLKVAEQQQFFARVLEASPAGVMTLDFDGRVSEVNPSAASFLGVTAEAAVGRPLAELASPLAAALGALAVGESCLASLGGGRRLKLLRAELFDRGFRRSFFLLEELTEELRASEKAAYGQLVRMMSHEVNNTVGAVGSLLDSFRAYGETLEAEDRNDFSGGIDVAIARLESLRSFTNGFAEVVRLPPPEPRPVDLRQLLDELLILLRPELERRRIDARWERAETVGPIVMDRNQMERVLVNGLKNALEAIGEDGRITLSLTWEGGRAVLAIADSGPGLPADVEPHLFTPFFSTKKDGRGLGLTLVREILVEHRFDFSLAPGRAGGAELRIRF